MFVYIGTSPSKNTRGVNNINYDRLHQIHVALGSRTIMAAPSLQDLCHDGETFAGTAADESVMLDWLAHIDSIIDNSLDAGSVWFVCNVYYEMSLSRLLWSVFWVS